MSTKPTNWIPIAIAAMAIATVTERNAAGSLIVPGYTESASTSLSGTAGNSNGNPPKKEQPGQDKEDFRTLFDGSDFTSTDNLERPFSSIALYALYPDFSVFDLLCTKLTEWPEERLPEPEPFQLLRPPDLSVSI